MMCSLAARAAASGWAGDCVQVRQ